MITFETQDEFEEAVKAVIRGSLNIDTSLSGTTLRLEVDGEAIAEAYLGLGG